MKISTKGRYGLRILADIAAKGKNGPRLIREISKSQNLSQKYVGRLMMELRAGGLVRSIRGARGGYVLAKSPSEISLLDILETMEGDLSIVACVVCPQKCGQSKSCAAREVWSGLNADIRSKMAEISLAQIAETDHSQTPRREH